MLTIDKPIINIFKHAGFVNVFLDFGSRDDMDLRVIWDVLTEYSRPANSVSYLPEELESGFYNTEDGPKMVYFPVLSLALSPIGREDSYMVHGYAPDSLLDSEVYQLINHRNRAYSPFTSPAMKQKCREDLDWFFRREKSTSSFRQRWLRYFRSEKFPHDKGPLAKLMGYFRRDQSELSKILS